MIVFGRSAKKLTKFEKWQTFRTMEASLIAAEGLAVTTASLSKSERIRNRSEVRVNRHKRIAWARMITDLARRAKVLALVIRPMPPKLRLITAVATCGSSREANRQNVLALSLAAAWTRILARRMLFQMCQLTSQKCFPGVATAVASLAWAHKCQPARLCTTYLASAATIFRYFKFLAVKSTLPLLLRPACATLWAKTTMASSESMNPLSTQSTRRYSSTHFLISSFSLFLAESHIRLYLLA